MQGMHAIGCRGRFFGGGEWRLRHSNHQVLKCPRCDSVDTKFCYYNNYNTSQPRHFCKSCRRYWTEGGVLRNLPIGGGCRKTKLSKQKSSAASKAQSSGSESSGPTAATPTSATTAAAEEGSFPINKPSDSSVVHNFPHARFFNANPNFDHQSAVNQSTEGQIFTTDNGSFTSVTTFGTADIPTTSCGLLQLGNQAPVSNNNCPGVSGTAAKEVFKMQEMTGGTSDEGVAAALGWGRGGGEYQGLFDLTAAVDPAYWSQPQWTDSDVLSPFSFQPYKSRFPNMFF